MIRIGILGSNGRMGLLISQLIQDEFANIAVVHARADRGGDLRNLLQSDVVIDFSSPSGMAAVADAAAKVTPEKLPAFVVGSTGWSLDERKALDSLAKTTPVLMSSNFSTGVLALLEVLRVASPLLEKLGYTPVVVEAHHRHKKDAPSGTALSIQRAISPAGPGNVQTHSIRAGEVFGDHDVTFYGPADQIRIGHHAQDRTIFARGAIQAALWLHAQPKSGMTGLIGIEKFFQSLKP